MSAHRRYTEILTRRRSHRTRDRQSVRRLRAEILEDRRMLAAYYVADFNLDGEVNGTDFLAWQRGVGNDAPLAAVSNGDGNRDSAVDAADLEIWNRQYGSDLNAGWQRLRSDPNGTNSYTLGSSSLTASSLAYEGLIGNSDAGALTGDVDGDGLLELVRVAGNQLFVHDETGASQLQLTLPTNGTLSALDDFNADGVIDIGIGAKSSDGSFAQALLYEGDGTLLQTFRRPIGSNGKLWPVSVIKPGIVLAGAYADGLTPRGLFAFDFATGAEVWGYDLGRPELGLTSVADIDADGFLESTVGWVTVNNGNNANGTTDQELYLTVTDDDGANLLTEAYISPNDGTAYHVFTDFEKDGVYEILAIERHDPIYYPGVNEVHLFDLDGRILRTHSGPLNEEWLWAVADVDNDGKQNVVVGGRSVLTILDERLQLVRSISEDGYVQLAADLTGNGYAEIVTLNSDNLLRVYDYELDLVDSIQLSGDARTNRGVIASDIDADGIVELIVQSSAGSHVVAFASATSQTVALVRDLSDNSPNGVYDPMRQGALASVAAQRAWVGGLSLDVSDARTPPDASLLDFTADGREEYFSRASESTWPLVQRLADSAIAESNTSRLSTAESGLVAAAVDFDLAWRDPAILELGFIVDRLFS